MASSTMAEARDRIAELAGRGLDLVGFWDEVRDALGQLVPYHLTPCWYTFDPASLLVTSHYDHGMIPELSNEWLAHEYFENDVFKLADVARSPRGIATLHGVIGGDPSASQGWARYVQPYGGDQQLLLALRDRADEAWGMLALYRAPGMPTFGEEELDFLRTLSPLLAQGARRALLVGEATDPEGPEGPGLIVLSEDFTPLSVSPLAERWLSGMPGRDRGEGGLPSAVLSVAGRALRAVEGPADDQPASARVRSAEDGWLTLHGSPFVIDGNRRIALIVQRAHPAGIAELLMSAYGLSEREKDVTRLVLQGNSTEEIAGTLFLSPHTVQEHLKRVFEKTGVRSRRELTGKVFFAHYEPRVRDNERRVGNGSPLRGGVWALQDSNL